MGDKKENLHENHRQRLKSKVKNYGLDCLAYHEILELLLTYTIPRKDTNPTAHELIERFGSFAGVIDADFHDLQKVKGVGSETALFFNVLSSFMEIYSKSKLEARTAILTNTQKCVQFFRDYYSIKDKEYMLMTCLGKNKKVVKTFIYKGHDEAEISFDLRQIANNLNGMGVYSVVFYHTHPNGEVEPSKQDIATTQSLVNICLTNGIDFDDHIILNESEHYSFNKNGLISKMKEKYMTVFNSSDLYIDMVSQESSRKKKDNN